MIVLPMGAATCENVDSAILKSLKNSIDSTYEIKLKVPECTFLGVQEQPDFADIYLSFYPNQRLIELKSLKLYIIQLRNIVISYERLINVIYDHLMVVYSNPAGLILGAGKMSRNIWNRAAPTYADELDGKFTRASI